jgi:hypothetical protein
MDKIEFYNKIKIKYNKKNGKLYRLKTDKSVF